MLGFTIGDLVVRIGSAQIPEVNQNPYKTDGGEAEVYVYMNREGIQSEIPILEQEGARVG